MSRRVTLELLWLMTAVSTLAQRRPVLTQIDLPHPYYYREMYLPQLTSGPSTAAWLPDSQTLVFSMASSLWRQRLDSGLAEQLTSGAGYDYQPDCSRDGKWVVYVSYEKDAMELWALDLVSKRTTQLTSGRAVNVEPRFSPDGKRIVFVSTAFHGHFHIFVGDFHDGQLSNVRQLTAETRSDLPRVYYSAFDHEISPTWTPDGSEIMFVSNRGHIYGTGGFWCMKAEPGAEAREIHYEETTWKARPEFSPDGKRVVYASYLGQQWHQLWLMPSTGGDAFPISYGEFDNINPRWSPDGKKIAFISNRNGTISLWVQEIPGGAQTPVVQAERAYLNPTAELVFSVVDVAGKPTAARISLTGEDGKAVAANDAWIQADDSYSLPNQVSEAHYFETSGKTSVTVPVGKVRIEVTKGLDYEVERRELDVKAGEHQTLTIHLRPLQLPPDAGRWVSGDLHVHMNYGGTYRNTPQHLIEQAEAENVGVVENLIVNKEQRIPDIAYFGNGVDAASTADTLLAHDQEFHTGYWGHLGLLGLRSNFLLPGYAAYVNTAAASLFPMNADIADLAHAQGALVGYVHPDDRAPNPADLISLTYELPVDVALGKVDYIEVVAFSDHGDMKVAAGDHKGTAEVWYRLLNCGFRLPAGAGTDAMANFAQLRGPVGLDRMYASVPAGPLQIDAWQAALKHGHTFATNGPLLGFTLGGAQVGDEVKLNVTQNEMNFSGWLRSYVPVDHLEIVCNGKVLRDLSAELGESRMSADVRGTIPLERSGWCLLRAYADKDEEPVFDAYPYATTSAIYVSVAGRPAASGEDAAYFVRWIDRMTDSARANAAWNSDAEKQSVKETLQRARAVYAAMEK